MNIFSRRNFIRTTSLGVTAVVTARYTNFITGSPANELVRLCEQLSMNWGKTLLSLQIKNKSDPHYGTIIYPPENIVHGRMGDTIYPFVHLAKRTNDHAWLDAAVLLYNWMERTVSEEDGSWLNEPQKGAWKGITVFTTIALAETIKNHGEILDPSFRQQILNRLKKSSDFIYTNFSVNYGNINYPVAASYALSLTGQLLNEPRYTQKGRELAHAILPFFTKKDHLLHGEGTPYDLPSAKGCFSVDLGYNVEESLPSLVQYALLTNDQEVLAITQQSMEAHLEFMLPDGGWDNSWGTRNYKWTRWGSRTSDGCLPAYGLLAAKNPVFHKAALRNTELLSACTFNGILNGSEHYITHGVPASLHHTFCHLKSLVTLLDHGINPSPLTAQVKLPREKIYGTHFFSDVQTWLVAKGKFRATVTGYDRNYKDFKGGHASGGAMSLLWHEKAGLILSGSMNEYQLYEAGNMQPDKDPLSIPLTPRIELLVNDTRYSNTNDFTAVITERKEKDDLIIDSRSRLVDINQQSPASGDILCQTSYRFTDKKCSLHFSCKAAGQPVQVVIPIISSSGEKTTFSPHVLTVKRNGTVITIRSAQSMTVLPTTEKDRVFNFVPGLEAIPLCIHEAEVWIDIEVA